MLGVKTNDIIYEWTAQTINLFNYNKLSPSTTFTNNIIH